VYQPDSCTSKNGSPSPSGVCQTLEFTDPDSLLYGPALSTCHEFYVLRHTSVEPSKRRSEQNLNSTSNLLLGNANAIAITLVLISVCFAGLRSNLNLASSDQKRAI
jgi:hypothetical protein